MIYLWYLVLLFILLFVERQQKNINNIFRLIIPLVYILLIGLRGPGVGVDTETYYRHYYTFGQWGCDFVEVGFDWLNRFCYHLGWSQAPFLCICAAIGILPVCYSIQKTTSRKEYSLFMLLFCSSTFVSYCNGVRQNMAVGIFFALIVMAETINTKKLYYLVLYIFVGITASLFHASVLLVLPLLLLKYVKLSNKSYILIYLFSFIFVFVTISSIIPSIQVGGRDYGHFLGGAMVNTKASLLGFTISTTKNILALIILCKTNAFKKYPLIANMAFLFFVIANLGYNIPLASRINMYFTFFLTYIIAKVTIENIKYTKSNIDIYLAAFYVIFAVLIIYGFISPANKLLPYSFSWEQPFYLHNTI